MKESIPEIKDLHLNLKGIYFDQIIAGDKSFEFRLVNDYWKKKLINRIYGQIHFKRGYPAKEDTSKIYSVPYRGYEIQTITHPHFGSDPVEVFAIYADDSIVSF